MTDQAFSGVSPRSRPEPPPNPALDFRQYEADFARFIAAAWVLFFHYGALVKRFAPDANVSSVDQIARYGYLGVPFFFCLSGYVISMSIERSPDPITFIRRRLRRIWPTLSLAAVITTLFLWASGGHASFTALWQNVVLFPILNDAAPNVDDAYWSLWLEFRFYLMAALVVVFKKRIKIEWFGYALVAFSALYVNLVISGQEEAAYFWAVRVISLNSWAGLFGSGILFSVSRREGFTPLRIGAIALAWVNSFPVLRVSGESAEDIGIGPPSTFVLGVLVVTFVGFFFWLTPRTKTVSDRWVRPITYLGALSYPLYLIHSEIGYRIYQVLNLPTLIEGFISTAMALGLGHALLQVDERLKKWKSRAR